MEASEIISTTSLVIPALVAAFGWLWQRWQERASVRVAIIAEVMALSQIAEQRNYQAGLFEMANALRAIPEEQRPPASLQVRVPEHYCRVYLANLEKLGYLPPDDAQLVVSFYQYIDSVVQDVTPGGLLHEGTSDPEAFAEAANVLQFAMDAAQKLSARHCRVGR
ncbi:MAG: hypothetical protein ABS977_21440 [Pseudomonas qingdaonensis]|uniref:hypothetical protein n=1 Tax=Pseudomonas TaxID=286 RepID=UPI0030CFA371